MLIVVAVEAQQFPVAAVGWIVVVVVIPVVDCEFMKVFAREFAPASSADPRIHLERLFPIALLALLSGMSGFRNGAV